MSRLTIYRDSAAGAPEVISDPDSIVSRLGVLGVEFERWKAAKVFSAEAGQEKVLAAYEDSIAQLNKRYGFQSVDVVALQPDHPDRVAIRQKFLAEHTHADFELRFFVEGKGLFYLHSNDRVYLVLCEKGDLISVPAETRHWFDMGEHPDFKCIRFFTRPDGWVATFTGSDIATRFPTFDEHLASLS